MAVTEENKHIFLELLGAQRMCKWVSDQLAAMAKGFSALLPKDVIHGHAQNWRY